MEYATEAVIGFVAFVSLVQLARKTQIKRPEGKVDALGVCFTLQDSYSSTDIKKFLELFIDEWLVEFPADKRVVKSVLKSLNIHWSATKLKFADQTVNGYTEDLHNIHLWVGPRLVSGKRDLVYTALLDQVIKIICRVSNKNVDKFQVQIERIISNVYRKLS